MLSFAIIPSRKWQNHIAVPLEALGGRDIHQIQTEDIQKESDRRRLLQEKFATYPDLSATPVMEDDQESLSQNGEDEGGQGFVSVSAAMVEVTAEETGHIPGEFNPLGGTKVLKAVTEKPQTNGKSKGHSAGHGCGENDGDKEREERKPDEEAKKEDKSADSDEAAKGGEEVEEEKKVDGEKDGEKPIDKEGEKPADGDDSDVAQEDSASEASASGLLLMGGDLPLGMAMEAGPVHEAWCDNCKVRIFTIARDHSVRMQIECR